MTILLYFAKMTLASYLLYGYYRLFLSDRQFHRYNRFYLLFAAAVAAIAPFITIPLHARTQGVPADRSFITDNANQEKVARSILQGIVGYQQERH